MIRVLVQPAAIDVAAELDLDDAGGHGASASFILPSCGLRRSEMSRSAMIFMRAMIAWR